MENNNIEAKSNDFTASNEDNCKSQQNPITYDPDDYLYKYYYDTLLHDEICFSCEYRKHYHCTTPNGKCNYVPLNTNKSK